MSDILKKTAKDDEAPLGRIAGEISDLLAAYPIPGWVAE